MFQICICIYIYIYIYKYIYIYIYIYIYKSKFKKMKKLLEISSFYTYVPKMTVIWCTAPEIWSATEFLSFWGPFFPIWNILLHISTINEDHMIHGSWNIMCNTEFFVILGHFLLFHPLTTQKIKVLKNWLVHNNMCTINDNHMMYAFSFFVIFCHHALGKILDF